MHSELFVGLATFVQWIFVGLGILPFPVKLVQHVAEPQWPVSDGTPEERALELDARVRRILQDLLRR